MNKVNEKNKKEFQRNKETINIKEFMLLKSGEQDKLIEEALNKVYEENVEISKKHIDKVLNVAFDNKDNETFLPHSLCVQKDGNKLIFSFKKSNKALLILFLLGFLFIAGFATFSGVQLIGKSWMNIDLNGDGVPDLNLDLNDDGVCEVNCAVDKDSRVPEFNIAHGIGRKPKFNIKMKDENNQEYIFNKMNQKDENGKCLLNCDIDGDGWPDINIDIDGDGKVDLNIDSDGDGTPDLNIDTNGDGVADVNIDEDADGKCDKFCTYVIDQKGGQISTGGGDVTLETAALVVNFEAGSNVSIDGIYPDDQNDPLVTTDIPEVKFNIENRTNDVLYYNIYWTEVENTFLTDNFQVKIDSPNGGYTTGDWVSSPKQNGLIKREISIAPLSKQDYVVDFRLHGTGKEQNIDQGKSFKGRILVELIEGR